MRRPYGGLSARLSQVLGVFGRIGSHDVSTLDRLERICGQDLSERALRAALLAVIRKRVPCDAYVWVLTDPETCVGAAPLAETPSLATCPR